jgi:hypothetical protein
MLWSFWVIFDRFSISCCYFSINIVKFLFEKVDQAGANAFRWWKSHYPNLQLWLPPIGKSPGDAWEAGIDLRRWIVEGICESD